VVRTQIQLTEEQARRLRRVAREQGVSVAEVVRRCVESTLTESGTTRSARYARAAKLIGTFRDPEGARDLAVRHDQHLNEAFE
jgi:hypothetical protein